MRIPLDLCRFLLVLGCLLAGNSFYQGNAVRWPEFLLGLSLALVGGARVFAGGEK